MAFSVAGAIADEAVAPGDERARLHAERSAVRPTDASSPPRARAVRERGREGRGLCVSENPDGGAGERDDVAARRPAPPAPRGGAEPDGGAVAGSRVTGSAGPRVELERARPTEYVVLFLTRLFALSLPPPEFLARAYFSPSELSRFFASPSLLHANDPSPTPQELRGFASRRGKGTLYRQIWGVFARA